MKVLGLLQAGVKARITGQVLASARRQRRCQLHLHIRIWGAGFRVEELRFWV